MPSSSVANTAAASGKSMVSFQTGNHERWGAKSFLLHKRHLSKAGIGTVGESYLSLQASKLHKLLGLAVSC